MTTSLFEEDAPSARIADETDRRLRELRANPEVLLARFDRNGDGVLDADEWAVIRSVIASEVAASMPGARQGSRLQPQADTELLAERYEILSELGKGAHGQTRLAKDRRTDRFVAVKTLHFEGIDAWKTVELFEREAAVLGGLSHPGIPGFVDAFEVEQGGQLRMVLVQEYIPGETLDVRLAQGELFDADRLRDIARQTLDILRYLHGLTPPVLHRDIKPSNLVQTPEGEIVLVDFGAVEGVSAMPSSGTTVVGTSGYMPPEQLVGRAVPPSDLYGLGATLVHLATRRHPADLPIERNTLKWRSFASLPAELCDWLERLLEPFPEDRFRTAAQALGALNQGASGALMSPAERIQGRVTHTFRTLESVRETPGRLEVDRVVSNKRRVGWQSIVPLALYALVAVPVLTGPMELTMVRLMVVIGLLAPALIGALRFSPRRVRRERLVFDATGLSVTRFLNDAVEGRVSRGLEALGEMRVRYGSTADQLVVDTGIDQIVLHESNERDELQRLADLVQDFVKRLRDA